MATPQRSEDPTPQQVDFFFDFISPYTYLAQTQLPALKTRSSATFRLWPMHLLNLMKRDEEFSQQVSEARLDAATQPLVTVIQASRKNWRAAAWLARFLEERRRRSYETTPEESEVAKLKGRRS